MAGRWDPLPGGGVSDLDDLSDVDLTTEAPADGDSFIYDGTAGMWVPGTPAAAAPNFRGCSLTRGSNQSIPTGTNTAVLWTGEDFDTDSLHDTGSNTSRVTIPSGLAGYWHMLGVVRFLNIADQISVAADLYKNGSRVRPGTFTSQSAASPTAISAGASGILNLAVGDYVELHVTHFSGADRDISSGGSFFSATFLGT